MEPSLADLNLSALLALEVLLEQRNVTAAATVLGVSQSALSHTLARLREQFGDPLLIRGPGGMQPTARAEALREPLRRGLGELRRALSEPSFDPATASRELTIAAGDSATSMLIPRLLELLGERAPKVDVIIRPVDPLQLAEQLERGAWDLACAVLPPPAPGLVQQRLTTEGFRVLVRADHPEICGTIDLDQYVRWPHALISPAGRGDSIVDRVLARYGRTRRIALRVPYFVAAPVIVARSNVILTAPQWTAYSFAELLGLQCLAPPIELPVFDVVQVWHERWTNDPFHAWVRGCMVEVAAELRGAIGELPRGGGRLGGALE